MFRLLCTAFNLAIPSRLPTVENSSFAASSILILLPIAFFVPDVRSSAVNVVNIYTFLTAVITDLVSNGIGYVRLSPFLQFNF